MTLKYFGTDGIRGPFGKDPISTDFAAKLGEALGAFLKKRTGGKAPVVVIGRDTRASGHALEKALIAGLAKHSAHIYPLGVVPTPAVALNTKGLRAHMGVAITASHNPHTDNGIKCFNAEGYKLTQEEEAEIETLLEGESLPEGNHTEDSFDGYKVYTDFLKGVLPLNALKGWKIALDLANGATYKSTPEVLKHYGAELSIIGDAPSGENINDGIGSEHPEKLADLVKTSGATIGIAHDGDGDRMILSDATGNIVDGDQVLGLLALHFKKDLVATVQSNLGLDKALEAAGLKSVRAAVGDRNVLYRMLESGYTLGGESSGHIIFSDIATTGDGLLAALKVIQVMLETGKPLSQLAEAIRLFPQKTKAIQVPSKPPLESLPKLTETIAQLESELGDSGRLLVRYSGTEPKLRLLAEGPTEEVVADAIHRLTEAVAASYPQG